MSLTGPPPQVPGGWSSRRGKGVPPVIAGDVSANSLSLPGRENYALTLTNARGQLRLEIATGSLSLTPFTLTGAYGGDLWREPSR